MTAGPGRDRGRAGSAQVPGTGPASDSGTDPARDPGPAPASVRAQAPESAVRVAARESARAQVSASAVWAEVSRAGSCCDPSADPWGVGPLSLDGTRSLRVTATTDNHADRFGHACPTRCAAAIVSGDRAATSRSVAASSPTRLFVHRVLGAATASAAITWPLSSRSGAPNAVTPCALSSKLLAYPRRRIPVN